ncbi:TPA: hypothetical protein I8Z56_001516 [Legionella pneumophila]|nr:hypothetical protein [Legionella pneumophila]
MKDADLPIIPHLKIQPLKPDCYCAIRAFLFSNNPSSKNPTTETNFYPVQRIVFYPIIPHLKIQPLKRFIVAGCMQVLLPNNPSSKNPTTETKNEPFNGANV